MQVEAIATNARDDRNLLRGLRRTLDGADEAVMCVAFASMAGVNLLRRVIEPIKHREGRATLLVTTVFGSSAPEALALARDIGVDVRVMNLPSGTFHPKVYVGRHGDRVKAVVGSANLTGGLVTNIEMATLMEGEMRERELAFTLAWARDLVRSDAAVPWVSAGHLEKERLDDALLLAIHEAVRASDVFPTVQQGRKNIVTEVTPHGVYVETARTSARGAQAQLVPAWMIQLAWDYLRANGALSNRVLREDLRVMRSSFVCGLLARLPGVEPTRDGVRWSGS